MLLAEAIKHTDYLSKSINNIERYIKSLTFVSIDSDMPRTHRRDVKSNSDIIEDMISKLDELYKTYQQYALRINRIEKETLLRVNEMELSLSDAMVACSALRDKLSTFENVLDYTFESEHTNFGTTCIDAESIMNITNTIRLDIQALETAINKARWTVDV